MTDQQVAAVSERYRTALLNSDDPHDWAYSWRSELNRGGFRAVDFLMDEIVDTGKCVGCASCITICPTDVFDYVDEKPVMARGDACVQCVLCADVCPVLRPVDANLPGELGLKQPIKDDGYGPYSYELYARSVSTILINELERGSIRGAILGDTEPDDPQVGRHKLATTEADILSCGGSRYTYSPNTLALMQAMEENVRPVAVVGVPCQVDGMRLQQHSSIRMEINRWYRANVTLVIGLFCSEAFTHESLDALAATFEVDRTACLYCTDYTAENADIGVGGIGLDNWSYVAVRTDAGHKALQQAIEDGHLETKPIEDFAKGKEILIRLAQQKMGRPLPALMPTLQEREKTGDLDPKIFGDKLAAIARGETV